MPGRSNAFALLAAALVCAPALLRANTLLASGSPAGLALFNLGTIGGINSQYTFGPYYEGLAISGDTLLMTVGDPSVQNQTVWALPLVRSNNRIVAFGSPSAFATVPGYPNSCASCFGNIPAGGLAVSGGGLLYTTMANSFLGQYSGGSTGLLDLAPTGATTGGLNYVPASFTGNGANQLKISSADFNGAWYTLNLGGTLGSYTLDSYTQYNVGVPAFSFDFVPVGKTFTNPGVILGDAFHQRLDYYQLDSNGNPCNPASNVACGPVIHLVNSDVQIGLGVVRDPVTGDILFTTGANEIWRLSDSADSGVPEPGSVLLVLGGIGLIAWRNRRVALRSSSGAV